MFGFIYFAEIVRFKVMPVHLHLKRHAQKQRECASIKIGIFKIIINDLCGFLSKNVTFWRHLRLILRSV